jgi:hypothetical protein
MQYVRAYGVGVDRRCDREEDYTPVSRVVAFRHKALVASLMAARIAPRMTEHGAQ